MSDVNDEYRIQAIIESSENDLLKMEISDLEQQLAERDALILELEKIREFYADLRNWWKDSLPDYGYVSKMLITMADADEENFHTVRETTIGGKLARTPLKNQALLDEIKGRVE